MGGGFVCLSITHLSSNIFPFICQEASKIKGAGMAWRGRIGKDA